MNEVASEDADFKPQAAKVTLKREPGFNPTAQAPSLPRPRERVKKGTVLSLRPST